MNPVPKLVIGCDLFLDLKLYRVPDTFYAKLRREFQQIVMLEFNTRKARFVDPAGIDIYWGNRITKKLIHELTSLKWVHFGSVGVNDSVMNVVKERNIRISNSRGIMTDAVAATGLAFMFALARGFHHAWKLRSEARLDRTSFDSYFEQVQDVFGQSVLIAGFGEIGEKLGRLCYSLGMHVSVVKRDIFGIPEWVSRVYTLKRLLEAVRNTDYVVNLLPLTSETKDAFSFDVFSAMKSSAFFINIGRGNTTVEDDLIKALQQEIIAGAGLDVFRSSSYVNPAVPLYPNSPLWKLDNAILTPHVAGLTNQYWEKECALFFKNLQRFRDRKKLINEVFAK